MVLVGLFGEKIQTTLYPLFVIAYAGYYLAKRHSRCAISLA